MVLATFVCTLETLRLTFQQTANTVSDTLFAIKTKSLTVKCSEYRIYSKYQKLGIETHCLTTETLCLILNDFLLT